MSTNPDTRSLLGAVAGDFRSSWKSLVLTDLVFKAIAFIVLTPLVGVLFRALIATSGSAVVSDMDILFFFLGPVGWICAVVVGALWLGIVALEQASLTGIICARNADKNLGTIGALRFAASKAWPVIRVTIRIVGLTLLAVAPFLAVAALVYFSLLTEYDINYYLKEKPPVFGVAVAIGVVIVAAMVAFLLRLFTGWFFALPLVLFENVNPRDALKLSVSRARGRRRTILCWIVGWVLATAVLSALATAAVGLVGRLFIPDSTDSLRLLAVGAGVTVLSWAIVSLAVNLLSTTTFAAILFGLYRDLGRNGVAGDLRTDFAKGTAEKMSFGITPRRLLFACVVGLVAALVVGGIALRGVHLDENIQIMAHRGSSKAAPENTMAAIKAAIEEGADWVEIDVQETADGEVVVFHDADFMRFAHNDLKLWNATMEDLKKIDIGSWFAPEFKAERVPTLAEVLDECQGKIRVNIELKYYGHDKQLEKRVADIVESRDMASDIMLMSLKPEGIKKMKAVRPKWKVGQLMSVAAGDLEKIEADFLAVNAKFATRRLVRKAHDAGMDFYVWTVNDACTMSSMMSRGVDGVLTDKPALARSVLEQRTRMSPPERLLLGLAGMLGVTPEIGEQ